MTQTFDFASAAIANGSSPSPVDLRQSTSLSLLGDPLWEFRPQHPARHYWRRRDVRQMKSRPSYGKPEARVATFVPAASRQGHEVWIVALKPQPLHRAFKQKTPAAKWGRGSRGRTCTGERPRAWERV